MKRMTSRTQGARRFVLAVGGSMAWLAACSFQDFSSLDGGDDSGTGDGDGDGDGDTGSGGRTNTSSGGRSGNEGGESSGGQGETGDGDGDMGGMGGAPEPELLNPSFETGSTLNWEVSPSSAIASRHVYVQFPTGEVPAPDGNYELAFWHATDSYDLVVSQKLTGLSDGTYTFSGYFSRGANLLVTMFAKNCSAKDPTPKEIPSTDPSSFTRFSLTGIEVKGGSCEVGITVEGGPNDWMNADLFALTRE